MARVEAVNVAAARAKGKVGKPEVGPSPEVSTTKSRSFLGKAAGVAGAVLNSPLLYTAPMLLPLIPSGGQDQSQETPFNGSPMVDPQQQALMQQQILTQQMAAMGAMK
jgi:hypothetical protein